MSKQNLLSALVGACILVAGIFIGAKWFGSTIRTINGISQGYGTVGSPAGTTFSSAKVAQINMSPTAAGTNATTSSILNSDATDRYVQDSFFACSGVGTSKTPSAGAGLATLRITAATTSTSVPNTLGNTNYVMFNNVSTSTPDVYNASSTIAVADYGRVWASGSYMTFMFNATNTAACTLGVHYLGS